MKTFTKLCSVTVLATTMAISLSTQAAEEVKIQQITDLAVKKNIEIVNLQMTNQINQDIQTSLNTMLMPKLNEANVLLAKSTNETMTSAASEE